VTGALDRFGPDVIDGWITIAGNPSPPVEIVLLADDLPPQRIRADIWRTDLQEARQGDGRWGFTVRPPAALADGKERLVRLSLADGRSILYAPVLARFDPGSDILPPPVLREPPFEADAPYRPRPGVAPGGPDGGVLISVIVVFYNMQREAARTLHSLSRAYQRDIGDLRYEVVCIDNGSDPPLAEAFVRSFGPEFSLIRPERPAPSPVAAMNAAAAGVRGHHVALMIDGAHILSPGVFREVADTIAEAPGAAVALRQWFVGGDQRFLSNVGWTRAQEDMLFDRIAWPANGYDLFRISTPVWESPNHWFDSMGESNCLFVPVPLFQAIGGFDEAFDEAGAGYANLDLFHRVAKQAAEPMVALVGEATFHQFHDGTTTNVDPQEKDRRVRGFASKYTRLRGQALMPVEREQLRLRGQIRARSALVARQRPLSPANVGVTTKVRAAELATHFDHSAVDYLVSVYAEAGMADAARWRGKRLGIAPTDAMALGDIVAETRPSHAVCVGVADGLAGWLRDLGRLDGGFVQLVTVRENEDRLARATLSRIRHALACASETMVLLALRPEDEVPTALLRGYAEFVSLRGYLVVIGSARGQPWLGYSRTWTAKAIHSFLADQPFAMDTTRTAHLITACPMGFLQRIGPVLTGQEEKGPILQGIS
jgi:glycosyltransferase involved in cell wall biosynthesis/cephalosporin hydroxylase